MFLLKPRRMKDRVLIGGKVRASLVNFQYRDIHVSFFSFFTFQLYVGCCMALAGECWCL